MSEKDLENQLDPENSGPSSRIRRGRSGLPQPPIDDDDELAYIYHAAKDADLSGIPLPPKEDTRRSGIPPAPRITHIQRSNFYADAQKALGLNEKSMNEAATDNKDDATSSVAEPPRTEGGGSPETKGSQGPQKAQKAASRTSASRTTKSASTPKKSRNKTSTQSSHRTSTPQQVQAQKDDAYGMVWVILYYAYLLIGFPVFLLTSQICAIIANVFDMEDNSQLLKIIRWSYERTLRGFALWRKIVFIIIAIMAVVFIFQMIFK